MKSNMYVIENIEINDKIYQIYIGKNAIANEQIIKLSHPESIWFHFNNISSAHIILDSKGDNIPQKYINQIALKLFEYKKHVPNNINAIYTKVKNVKLTNKCGTVITRNTRIIKF